ncbi:MAG: substrate-binding domain-containing protein, partial [Chloroflexota bacterium]
AAATAARHLADNGYQRIGVLGARRDPRSSRRLDGFRAALESSGAYDPARVLFSKTPSSVSLRRFQVRF